MQGQCFANEQILRGPALAARRGPALAALQTRQLPLPCLQGPQTAVPALKYSSTMDSGQTVSRKQSICRRSQCNIPIAYWIKGAPANEVIAGQILPMETPERPRLTLLSQVELQLTGKAALSSAPFPTLPRR